MKKEEEEEFFELKRGIIIGYAMCVTMVNSKTILENAETIDNVFMFTDRFLKAQGLQLLTKEEKDLIRSIERKPWAMVESLLGALKEYIIVMAYPREN